MRIHNLPKKRRERAHGHSTLLVCADELEAHLRDAALCHVSTGTEIHFDLIVSDSVFKASITQPTSCTLSTRSGDTRRATLVFA